MSKPTLLAALAQEMAADKSLPLETNLVFGEGNPDCDLLFIGEAPGEQEDRDIRPFVGRGGQLLRRCLRDAGFKEEEVYITNIVKRRPPNNRDPLPEEIAAYKPYLSRQIEIITPKVIVPLGRFSMNYFLPEAKITRDQGKVFRIGRYFIVPFFHPAAVLRGTANLKDYEAGFRKLPAILKKWEAMKPKEDKKTQEEARLF